MEYFQDYMLNSVFWGIFLLAGHSFGPIIKGNVRILLFRNLFNNLLERERRNIQY